MKFGAAVILYNPSKEDVNNLLLYQKIFDTLFVFDNSDKNPINSSIFYGFKNVIYISNDENMGISFAYNKIIYSKECKNLDYLCTLDQDSRYSIENIKNMFQFINNNKMKNVGIISPQINYGEKELRRTDNLIEKKWVITSGSFINLKSLYKYKITFDENYFIDRCDVDLCKQLSDKKLKIFINMNSILIHELGNGNKKKYSNHAVIRHYYIFRNRLYYNNKWFGNIKKRFLNLLQSIKHIIRIILFEDEKIKKIKILKKAFFDYKNGKMGKINF